MEPSSYRERVPPTNVWALAHGQSVRDLDDASALAQAIVDTIRDPLLVLDQDLRVVTANRVLLSDVQDESPGHSRSSGLRAGRRPVGYSRASAAARGCRAAARRDGRLQSRAGFSRHRTALDAAECQGGIQSKKTHRLILLAIEDVTERRAAERQMAELLQQKETLLQEMQHRVANSLQIIASILMLKARTVESAETRLHLQDAHVRVMSVATVQQQLQASAHGGPIELGPYLSRLCDALAVSMIGDSRPITVKVEADPGTGVSTEAVSMGLITTELVINALKHAFPDGSGGGKYWSNMKSTKQTGVCRCPTTASDCGRTVAEADMPAWGLPSSKRSRISSTPASREPADRRA